MNTILNDLSDESAVIQAIETNMFSFWTAYGQVSGGEVFEDERLSRVAVPFAHPLYNAVFGVQLTITQIDPTIREQIQYFSARRTPFYWWTGPLTRPSDLELRLLVHDLIDDGGTPGMAIDLATLPESVPIPEGFEIVSVTDEERLRQWTAVGGEDRSTDDVFQLEQARGFGNPPTRYLGLLEGVPVAHSVMHLDSGVVGVYSVFTKAEARGKGIGTAMTLKPYLDARANGYHVGILQSSTMGYPIYRRLGFKKYCDLGVYLYQGA